MRLLMTCLCLCWVLLGMAKNTLSDSVNQAKSEGKVLSAKTRNGEHVVKVLTPEGKIVTIRESAIDQSNIHRSLNEELKVRNKKNNNGVISKPPNFRPTNKSSDEQKSKKRKNNSRTKYNNTLNRQDVSAKDQETKNSRNRGK